MTQFNTSIFDRMTVKGSDTSRTGKLRELIRSEYSQTPERTSRLKRIKFYGPISVGLAIDDSIEAPNSSRIKRLKTPAVAMRFRNTLEAKTQ